MKSEQINELATALSKAQPGIKSAIKDSANPFFKSKYADLHSTWEACREALNKNGLSIVQTLDCGMSGDFLVTMLLHSSGQWISGTCRIINSKGDSQGFGSSVSYMRRYSLAAICGVTAEDDDGQAAVGKPVQHTEHPSLSSTDKISEKQAKMVYARLVAKGYRGADQKEYLMSLGYHFTEDIPYVKLDEILAKIDKLAPKVVETISNNRLQM